MNRQGMAEETQFISREEFERVLPLQGDAGVLRTLRMLLAQVSRRMSREFGVAFPELGIATYSDPEVLARAEQFGRVPAHAFVSNDRNRILVNLASREMQKSVQDVIVHELAHKVYDARRGDLSFDIDDESFADVIVKGFSRDPNQPFNPSTAPKQYSKFQRIMNDLGRDTMRVATNLDKVASRLESCGMVRVAYELDLISNALDAMGCLAPDALMPRMASMESVAAYEHHLRMMKGPDLEWEKRLVEHNISQGSVGDQAKEYLDAINKELQTRGMAVLEIPGKPIPTQSLQPGQQMPRLAAKIDELASIFESGGCLKEAETLDTIANTFEMLAGPPHGDPMGDAVEDAFAAIKRLDHAIDAVYQASGGADSPDLGAMGRAIGPLLELCKTVEKDFGWLKDYATGTPPASPQAPSVPKKVMFSSDRTMSSRLDLISSYLEEKGMIHEAHELDIVSNTLEAGSFGQPLRARRDYGEESDGAPKEE